MYLIVPAGWSEKCVVVTGAQWVWGDVASCASVMCMRDAAMAKCFVGGDPEHYIAELVCGTARRPGSDTTRVCLPKRPLWHFTRRMTYAVIVITIRNMKHYLFLLWTQHRAPSSSYTFYGTITYAFMAEPSGGVNSRYAVFGYLIDISRAVVQRGACMRFWSTRVEVCA